MKDRSMMKLGRLAALPPALLAPLALPLAGCLGAPGPGQDPGQVKIETRLDPATGAVAGCSLTAPGVVGHTLDLTDCGKTVHIQADPKTTDTLSGLVLAFIAMFRTVMP